jgi:hypothetical protein
MQELTDSIKTPSLRIMGIEGEEAQAKGICNIFNKIIIENFPNVQQLLFIKVQEASRTPKILDQNRNSPQYIIKRTSTENRKRILKAIREKKQITYKVKSIKIKADFSMDTLKARKAWSEVFWALNENTFKLRILYSAKLPFKIHGTIKIFHNMQKLKQYMTTK